MNDSDRKAWIAGLLAATLLVAGIYFGSGGLKYFDPAVTWYVVGSILAAFAVGYRFTIWAQRPPARIYFKRGLQILFRKLPELFSHNKPKPELELGRALVSDFAAQNFIRKRSSYRWIMHLCLSGGCTLAFAITFPLVFGWIHFEALPSNAEIYRMMVFGFPLGQFKIQGFIAFVAFNLLNFSALLVLVGLIMAVIRRANDAGERATQTFFEDKLPLLLIFIVTVTGLMLTVSYKFLAGQGHFFIGSIHALSVIALLLYIPFGKLFHMFQRSASLCVSLYKKAGDTGPRAKCRRCAEDFASQMHVDDLKIVLDQLGFDFRFATTRGEIHYQDICPACRRKLLALNQGKTIGR